MILHKVYTDLSEGAMHFISPLRRHFFIPLWVMKDKSPRLKYAKELEISQFKSSQQIKETQFTELKKVLHHAYRHTSFYRERMNEYGITPEKIHNESDFKKIPILTKAEISGNHKKLISNKVRMECLTPFKTGGSTGVPVAVYRDFDAIEKGAGSALRSFKWTGWQPGEPWGRIWGNPPERKTLKEKLRNTLIEPEIYLDTMDLSQKSMSQFVRKWRRVKPTLMHGHSHSIYIFAKFCKDNDIIDICPKGIISTSMMLLPAERRIIESTFGTRVTDLYGCEEVGLISCQCEQNDNLHINMENVFVEFLKEDGSHAPPGRSGAIVVTSLVNRAMPIIRYKVGDIGIPVEGQCACERNLSLMGSVAGRVADFFTRKDGSLVAGVSLVERILTAFPGIDQMQMIQLDLDNIQVNIVKGYRYDKNTELLIIKELKLSIGEQNNIHLHFVDEIKPEPSGKFRFAISKLKNMYS